MKLFSLSVVVALVHGEGEVTSLLQLNRLLRPATVDAATTSGTDPSLMLATVDAGRQRCQGHRCWNSYHHGGVQPDGIPSCDDALFDMLVVIAAGLNRRGLDWFLCFGTLLGAVRNENIIPWTGDVDICLKHDSYEKVKNGGPGFLHQKNYTTAVDQSNGDVVRGCGDFSDGDPYKFSYQKGSFVYMDLYDSSSTTLLNAQERQVISSAWEHRKNVTIRGHKFPAPVDSKHLLEINYGTNWMTPDAQHSAHG